MKIKINNTNNNEENFLYYYENDFPSDLTLHNSVAIDTETMGLNNHRDRLCLVQFSFGDGNAHLIRFKNKNEIEKAHNLKKMLTNTSIKKIFHFARFDVAILQISFGIKIENIYCTKIASRLCRTYTDHHGLKDLCEELLGVKISKQQQSSDWGQESLKPEQLEYAAKDVLYLHRLKTKLDSMLERENRLEIANKCFEFMPYRAIMDAIGYGEEVLTY